MSQQTEYPDPEERIATTLIECRTELEAIAETETRFGERAQNALDWLAAYDGGETDG
ncbi:hypothetical protein [Haloarcula sp. 1CSR25-25]|uniref:hypothetical protein n=1 Tax=Haloarcula sp. 1CSR25-25 TaxID=2862545 RepID=UPI00289562F4|nr:hypothetical protein [Haloarcula sp. 1CSR25-25]MDT3434644.1 hypothetical protein [Haloarcula sp. 1CSR25-25]